MLLLLYCTHSHDRNVYLDAKKSKKRADVLGFGLNWLEIDGSGASLRCPTPMVVAQPRTRVINVQGVHVWIN